MKAKFTKATVREILRGFGLDGIQAKQATIQIIEALARSLVSGERVELRGLGSLEVKERIAHIARNPKTGEAVNVPPRRRVVFYPGQELKIKLVGEASPM